jgi:hypothetical protein
VRSLTDAWSSAATVIRVTSERAQAYGRVVRTLADLSASKLHTDEQQVVRDAADALFFCEDVGADPAAHDALAALYELADRLVESDRLLPETAAALISDVEACGPFVPVG